MAVQFGDVVATTIRHYGPQITENILTQEVLLWKMREGGRTSEYPGGEAILEPLMYAENANVGSYNGADQLPTAVQSVIDGALFEWKQVAGTCTYTGREEFQNSGSKERMVNLITGKLDNLQLSLMLEMNRQMFLDGTGNGGKDITGLNLAVEDGTAWSTYGGINSDTYSFWRNQWVTGGVFGTGLNGVGISDMRTIYYSCMRGKDAPDIGFTTQAVYELYELALGSAVRIVDEKYANAGFENALAFKGMTLFFDPDCPTAAMIFLNTKYLRFVVGKGKNFVTLPPVRPNDQDVNTVTTLVYCNFTCSNRRRQGRIDALVAS